MVCSPLRLCDGLQERCQLRASPCNGCFNSRVSNVHLVEFTVLCPLPPVLSRLGTIMPLALTLVIPLPISRTTLRKIRRLLRDEKPRGGSQRKLTAVLLGSMVAGESVYSVSALGKREHLWDNTPR